MTLEEGRPFIEPEGHTIDLVALKEWEAQQAIFKQFDLSRAANATAERDAADEAAAWGLPPSDQEL